MRDKDHLFKPYVHQGPLALGFVHCINAANPLPNSPGWHITSDKEYLVAGISPSGEWLLIVADDGKLGSYKRDRFSEIKKEPQDDKASS